MRRVWNVLGVGLLVLVVVLGAFAGYLATSNEPPRRLSEGWLRVKSLPVARTEHAAAVVEKSSNGPRLCPRDPCPDRLVYVAGGLRGPLGRTTDLVHVFDPPASAWREGPRLPEPRHHLAAAALGDTLFVTGGAASTRSFEPQRNVWVLRPGRTSFERLAAMPEGRVGHAMVVLGGKVYVVGGSGPSSSVLVYDPGPGTWSKGKAMPAPRDHVAAIVLQRRIYVIGGRNGDGVTKRVDIYDPATDDWSAGPPLKRASSAMAAALLADGLIHLVGGEDPRAVGGGVLDEHYVYDPIGNVWIEAPKPLLAVHGAPGLELQGKMLIVGGARRQGVFSVLGLSGMSQVFDPTLLGPGAAPAPTGTATPRPATSKPATSPPAGSPSASPTR